jgi:hypothetical protein
MATQAEVNLLRQQLHIACVQRDDALAAGQRLQELVGRLIDLTGKQASQLDRLMDIIEDRGMASFGDRGAGTPENEPRLH